MTTLQTAYQDTSGTKQFIIMSRIERYCIFFLMTPNWDAPQNPGVIFQTPEELGVMAVAPTSLEMDSGDGSDVLQTLGGYSQLLVKQKPRGACLELMCGYEKENEYKVYDPQGGTQVMNLREESTFFQRCCCSNMRAFEARLCTADDDKEIVRFQRPLHGTKGGCFCCCLPVCFQRLDVLSGADTANPGAQLGWVDENFSFFKPTFTVYDSANQSRFKIVGACCGCCSYKLTVVRLACLFSSSPVDPPTPADSPLFPLFPPSRPLFSIARPTEKWARLRSSGPAQSRSSSRTRTTSRCVHCCAFFSFCSPWTLLGQLSPSLPHSFPFNQLHLTQFFFPGHLPEHRDR
jgi:Scramblase